MQIHFLPPGVKSSIKHRTQQRVEIIKSLQNFCVPYVFIHLTYTNITTSTLPCCSIEKYYSITAGAHTACFHSIYFDEEFRLLVKQPRIPVAVFSLNRCK